MFDGGACTRLYLDYTGGIPSTTICYNPAISNDYIAGCNVERSRNLFAINDGIVCGNRSAGT